jgi:hypothetical protein
MTAFAMCSATGREARGRRMSLRTPSCDSDPPLIPPFTLTRSLAFAQVADW